MGFFSYASMIVQKDLHSQVKLEIYKGIRRIENAVGEPKLKSFNKETKTALWAFGYGISVIGFDKELDKDLQVVDRDSDSIGVVSEAIDEAGYQYYGIGNTEHYFYYVKGIEYLLKYIEDSSDSGEWRKVILKVSQSILDS